MKKYVVYIILAFAVMFFLPSCENGGDVDFADNTLTLTLSCNDLGLTRATVDGEDAYNENIVNSIDCYFYLSNADFNTPALLVKNNISTLTKTAFGTYTATIKFEEEELKTLFGTVNKGGSANALIYIIANRPTNVSLPMADGVVKLATINELKALTITSDFSKSQAQASFVMDSDGKPDSTNDTSVAGATNTDIDNDDIVTYTIDNNGTKSLTGVVPLYRTAAKITLSVNRFGQEGDNNTVTVGGKTYTPNYGGVYAVFHNGVSNSVIAPDAVSQVSPAYFETADFSMAAQAAPCQLGVPFYSYASDWSGETAGEEAYITLVVPWQANGETAYTPYYYKVPVNFSGDKLERNTHYKIDIAVSILGTLNPDSTITIEPSYTILNWSDDEIPTSMSDFRYLMVEQNSYVMNNINTINIPYWTSHDCEIVGVKVQRMDLNDGEYDNITSGYTLELRDGSIYYERELDNLYTSPTFDFTPYVITFTIQHTTLDEHGNRKSEDIKITQYPAIYGERDVNTDYTNGGSTNGNIGFVWINGYTGNIGSSSDVPGSVPNQYLESTFKDGHYKACFDRSNGLSSSGGVTSNTMLVFTISSVEGTKYVIGDPREESVNNDFINAKHRGNTNDDNAYPIWDYAPGVEGSSSRLLENYYATETNHNLLKNASSANATQNNIYANDAEAAAAERTYNMIAPKFRISSGYGAINTIGERQYYHLMKKRCAAYQEDGYPAGRWRLPTKAEFEFIIYLSHQGKIPTLFAESLDYWCAHGHGKPDDGTVKMGYKTNFGNSSYVSVRCVYDDWYWGSDPVIDTSTASNDHFIWGDVNRADKSYAPSINY